MGHGNNKLFNKKLDNKTLGSTSPKSNANVFLPLDEPLTQKQLRLLRDLWLLHGAGIPSQAVEGQWRNLDKSEARDLIRTYYNSLPRYDSYQGPEENDSDYGSLSEAGQAFADSYALPDEYFLDRKGE